MDLRVHVVGDGGIFDSDLTNPSFYIQSGDSAVLVGCGYNVFHKLKELNRYHNNFINNIKTIVIPRMDDEHMGSLRVLLKFKRYINKDSHVNIVCPDPELMKELIEDTQTIYISSSAHKKQFVGLYSLVNSDISSLSTQNMGNIRSINGIKCIYKSESYSVILWCNNNMVVAISGDTKANFLFESTIMQKTNKWLSKALIFHNLSSSIHPSKTEIACQNDFEAEYSQEFRDAVKPYGSRYADIAGRTFVAKELSGGLVNWVEASSFTQ